METLILTDSRFGEKWIILLSLTILLTLVILSSFLVVHSYAQELEEKHFLRVSSSPNIIYLAGGGFYDSGTSVTLKAPETWRDYKFEGWQVGGRWASENPLTILMNRDHSVEAIYSKGAGVDEIIVDAVPRVTEITVDGTIYLPSELPLSFDWQQASDHTIIISDIVNETPDTRYKFDSWKDRSKETFRSITVGEDNRNIIALYKTQHYFKPLTELGSVMGGGWHDEGSIATFELESDIIIDKKDENIRYVFDSWDLGDYPRSATNTINIEEPISAKATWNKQYKLVLNTNVPDYELFGTGWYYKERQVALIAEQFIESPNADTQYVFDRWVTKGPKPVIIPNAQSSTTTITIFEPYVILAQYKNSYKVNVWTSYSSGIGGGFYPEGNIAEIKISQTQVVLQPNKVRVVFDGWNTHGASIMDFSEENKYPGADGFSGVQNLLLLVNNSVNVTAKWKTQYYLDVQSSEGKVEGSGWYDLGRLVPISAKHASVPAGLWSTMTFDRWTGDYEETKQNGRVLINKPKTVIAEWKEDRTPAIFNTIILAGVGAVAFLIYTKTRNKIPKFNDKKPASKNEAGDFDRLFNTRRSLVSEKNTATLIAKPSRFKSIVDWLFGRD